jgi:hypothetical protein
MNIPESEKIIYRAAMTAEQTQSLTATNNWAHVDKSKVHSDWDILYTQLAQLIENTKPDSETVQRLMAAHYEIACRFYKPSASAYKGMVLFYNENPDMNKFHNSYHPKMVDFLTEAVFIYAGNKLA